MINGDFPLSKTQAIASHWNAYWTLSDVPHLQNPTTTRN